MHRRSGPRPGGSRIAQCLVPASRGFDFPARLRIGASYLKMTESDVRALALAGESETVEFKRTTGQLSCAAEALCAFLNAHGGQVLFGVGPDSQIAGQSVSDATMQDVAQVIRRFEPPAPVEIERVPLSSGQEILVLRASDNVEAMPFTYDGRAYQRIGTTTSVTPQETYQRLLLERAHARQRWEKPAITACDSGSRCRGDGAHQAGRYSGRAIGPSRLGSCGRFSRPPGTPSQPPPKDRSSAWPATVSS